MSNLDELHLLSEPFRKEKKKKTSSSRTWVPNMACCPDLESPFFSENEKSHGGLWDTGGHISLTRWWRDKHMGPSPGRHTACYRTRTHSARSPPWFAPFRILSTFPQFHRVPLRALSPSWGHVRSGLWQSFVTTFTARLFFAMLRKKKKNLMRKGPHWFPATWNSMVVSNRSFLVIIWSFLMFFKIAMHTISFFY